jgi:chemotaxis protein CheX
MPAAASLKEAILQRVGGDLAIDASSVERLGGSSLQVLLAAARTWKADGFSLTLERASPRFLEDLKLLGYEPQKFLDGAMAP